MSFNSSQNKIYHKKEVNKMFVEVNKNIFIKNTKMFINV